MSACPLQETWLSPPGGSQYSMQYFPNVPNQGHCTRYMVNTDPKAALQTNRIGIAECGS